MNYQLNNAYFVKKSMTPGIVLIVIGLIFLAFLNGSGAFAVILGIVLIALGAFLIYRSVNRTSDQQYDQSVAQNVSNMKARALQKLGMDEDEVKEIAPIIIDGYRFKGASKFKKGKDNQWLAGKPDWYHQSTNLGTASQLSWYRA